MKVLIVDASAVMREIVIRALRQAGHADPTCVEASNGREALDKIAEDSPDLILSDWNLPEISGIEILRILRERGSKIPFCFFTAEATLAMRTRAREAGAIGFVTKPFTPDQFREALGDLLG